MQEERKMIKKILVITGSYPPIRCGVGDYTNVLVHNLARYIERIDVLTSCDAKSENNGNINVLPKIKKWSGVGLLKEVHSIVSRNNYDAVNIQYPTSKYSRSIANYLLPMLLRLFGKKIIFTMHEYSDSGFLYKICRIPAILFSNTIIVVDDNTYEELCNQYSFLKKKIVKLHIGSNIPISPDDTDEYMNIRNQVLKKTNAKKIISYFGFVTGNKKLEVVLESLHLLKQKNQLSSVFLIIGELDKKNKTANKVMDLIEKYDLCDDVFVSGYVDSEKVGYYFQASDAAMLLFENGVSMRNGSFLAAQQEGIPVFTTESEDARKYLSDMKNVYLIKNSVDMVTDAILRIQNGNLERLTKKSIFDWDEIALKYIDIFKR